MIVSNIETVTILVVLLFGLPILWNARKNELLKFFSFIKLIKTINESLIFQGVLGVILILLSWLFAVLNFKIDSLMAGTTYTYLVVGIFMYLPILGILNLIRFIIEIKIRKQ